MLGDRGRVDQYVEGSAGRTGRRHDGHADLLPAARDRVPGHGRVSHTKSSSSFGILVRVDF